jgi:hypothetical protein
MLLCAFRQPDLDRRRQRRVENGRAQGVVQFVAERADRVCHQPPGPLAVVGLERVEQRPVLGAGAQPVAAGPAVVGNRPLPARDDGRERLIRYGGAFSDLLIERAEAAG